MLVPSQGLLNALAYGWTRRNFLSVIFTQRTNNTTRGRPKSLTTSLGERDEDEGDMEDEEEHEDEEVENERGEWERRRELSSENSLLSSFSRAQDSMTGERRQRGNTALTPVS